MQEKCPERPRFVAEESMPADRSSSSSSSSTTSMQRLAIVRSPFAARSRGSGAPSRILYPDDDIEKDSLKKRCCSARRATRQQQRPCSLKKKKRQSLFSVFFFTSAPSLPPPPNFYSAQSGLLPARGALRGRRGSAKPEGESRSERPSSSSSSSSRAFSPHRLHSPAAVAGARSAALLLAATSCPNPSRRARASKCGGGFALTVTPPSGARRVREEQ